MGASVGEFREIPGPLGRDLIQRAERVLAKTIASSSVVLSRADGMYMWDADGNKYLNFDAGISVANHGYGKGLAGAQRAIDSVLESGMPLYVCYRHNPTTIEAAENLVNITPIRGGAPLVFGCPAGSLAVEAAMKAIVMERDRRKDPPQQHEFLYLSGSFHGRTHGASVVMDKRKVERIHGLGLPYLGRRLTFPFQGDAESCEWFRHDLKSALSGLGLEFTAGIFIEIVQGEGGINIIDKDSLHYLDRMCQEHGIPLVVDEIQTGFGRCGSQWAYTQYGIEPDIVLFGKAAGYGVLPVSGMVIREELSFQQLGEHAGTFGLEPIFAAVLSENIRFMKERKIATRSKKMGEYLLKRLAATFQDTPYVKDIRGLGLLVGIEFCYPGTGAPAGELRDKTWFNAERYGLLTIPAGLPDINPVIRLAPPLCVTKKQIDIAVNILEIALDRSLTT